MNTPKDIKFVDVPVADGWVTDFDMPDLPDNVIIEGRGLRSRPGFILVRDFGTKHRYASYPTVPYAVTIVDGFTMFDPTTSTEYPIVVGYDDNSRLHVYVYDESLSGSNPGTTNHWIELTRVFTAKVDGTPAAGAYSVNLKTIKDARMQSYTPATDEFNTYVAWNVQSTNKTITYITDSTASSITADSVLGSSGLTWQDNDDLVIIKNFWLLDFLFTTSPTDPPTYASMGIAVGTSPHVRWSAVEAQRKVNMLIGTSASPPVMLNPMRIERKVARNFFYDGAGTPAPQITLQANWYAEKAGGGLTPAYTAYGTAVSGETPDGVQKTTYVTDSNGNAFIRIKWTPNQGASADTHTGLRVAITLLYDDYQESDPVYKAFLLASAGNVPSFVFDEVAVSFARMPKNITSIRFYAAAATQATVDAGWSDADSEYYLAMEVPFNDDQHFYGATWYTNSGTYGYFVTDTLTEYFHAFQPIRTTAPTHCTLNYAIVNTAAYNGTLSSILNHAIDVSRSYKTPRYCVRVTRDQGSLSIIDSDDRTLHTSVFDGEGVNNDDNFIDLMSDNGANKTKILLNGRAELMGLAVMNDVVYSFRKTEYETYDLSSGVQGIVACDFASKRSLISTPFGIFWAGNSAIWWLPISGGEAIPISRSFQNWYDGSLMIDNGTGSSPYLTGAYRSAIIAGWDSTYQEVWFHTQANEDTEFGGSSEYLCLRYSPILRKWLPPRELNISAAIKYFDQSVTDANGSYLTIGYASGLLRYPYRAGGSPVYYKDGVASDNSGGSAIITRITMNIGSIASIIEKDVLTHVLIDQVANDLGATTESQFTIEMFANNETIAYETKTQHWKQTSIPRSLPPRGMLQRIKIRLSLASTSTFGRWEVSKIALGFKKIFRYGNT